MKPNERSAHKVRGFLLEMPDGDLIFRVYGATRKEYKDYQIRHCDLEVEIVDNYSSFYDEKSEDLCGYIGYPSRLTDKFTKGESVVQ